MPYPETLYRDVAVLRLYIFFTSMSIAILPSNSNNYFHLLGFVNLGEVS